jgi:16S rRNA (cytosine1402-N4)-methyltransferase
LDRVSQKAYQESDAPAHRPVLLEECLAYLLPDSDNGDFPCQQPVLGIDCTLGEGGHSLGLLQKYSTLRIIGLDADPEIQARARTRLAQFGDRVTFHTGWFNDFFTNYPLNLPKPLLILFDLGISIFHYEISRRGFSFNAEEYLDMRLNPETAENASVLVNRLPEMELADLIYRYGQERYSRRIARAVAAYRKTAAIKTAAQLGNIVYQVVPAAYRHGKIHPATKTFQALRIAVNGELRRLFPALQGAFSVLAPGGKMGVISFHSLEDRIVKDYFRALSWDCICPPGEPICICGGKPAAELVTKKPVIAAEKEVAENQPSRSARLRVVCKLRDENPARKRFAQDLIKGV